MSLMESMRVKSLHLWGQTLSQQLFAKGQVWKRCLQWGLQETKRENFDSKYLRNFCPKKFNKFVFVPSVGASGGLIIIWNESLFKGALEF
jgi:hypothetical protein